MSDINHIPTIHYLNGFVRGTIDNYDVTSKETNKKLLLEIKKINEMIMEYQE